jgi:hypothetical protein
MDAHRHSETDDAMMLDDAMEAPPLVRFDERRMHIRAYNYWASLLSDRALPSIEDLNPSEIEDFGSHSVLLDFTSGIDDPSIAFLGTALSAQCDISVPIDRASQIPPRTLLSRLTDHYLQIIANAAPIGFEAEFINQRGNEIMYRGIMMPFSTDDDSIDFVYGVINWKEVASDALSDSIAAEVGAAGLSPLPGTSATPIWADRPSAFDADFNEDYDIGEGDDALELTDAMLAGTTLAAGSEESMLGDSLAAAREAAAVAHASEGRTRHALYRAIGLAHAFAAIAAARPDEYAALLADSGVEVQARSPLTALAKLVFGADYDKTRLAEFVCAIGYALDQGMAPGALIAHLHAIPGGLKGLVAQVRAARRNEKPAPAPRKSSPALRKLTQAGVIDAEGLSFDETGLAIAVIRREADGSLAMVATLDQQDRLTGRVYTAAAKTL